MNFDDISALWRAVTLYNLFDKKYVNASSTPSQRNAYIEAPQPGRVITAGLYYKF